MTPCRGNTFSSVPPSLTPSSPSQTLEGLFELTRRPSSTTCHTLKQVKQNATNNLAPFFRSDLNALSNGVICFAHCVATIKKLSWKLVSNCLLHFVWLNLFHDKQCRSNGNIYIFQFITFSSVYEWYLLFHRVYMCIDCVCVI